jgi:hypothetical protein
MRTFGLIVLWLGGLGFLAFGIAFLVAPLSTMAMAGLQLSGDLAATELMAFYGGIELALGAVLIACALSAGRLRDGLTLSLIVYGSIAAARIAGMLSTGADSTFLRAALALEAGLAIASAIALFAGGKAR